MTEGPIDVIQGDEYSTKMEKETGTEAAVKQTIRGANRAKGKNIDIETYSLLRNEFMAYLRARMLLSTFAYGPPTTEKKYAHIVLRNEAHILCSE